MPSYNVNQWRGDANYYGKRYGIPPALILGIIKQQSGGNPSALNTTPTPAGPTHAMGLGQFEPGTWNTVMGPNANPFNGKQNVQAIAKYLSSSRRQWGGNLADAYGITYAGWGGTNQPRNVNASQASWQSLVSTAKQYGAVPASVEHQRVSYRGVKGVAGKGQVKEYGRGYIGPVQQSTGTFWSSLKQAVQGITGQAPKAPKGITPMQQAIVNMNLKEHLGYQDIKNPANLVLWGGMKVTFMTLAVILIVIGLLVMVWTPGTRILGTAARMGAFE